jgi:hypothetical protein
MKPVTQDALSAVLDRLIPGDAARGLPAAGAIGLPGYVAERLGDALASLEPGFAALDAAAREQSGRPFAELGIPEGNEVLRRYAERDPGFLPALLFHGYAGYYQNPAVLEALGMEGRPPHPKGYELEAGDLTLLDPVRGRRPFYREI